MVGVNQYVESDAKGKVPTLRIDDEVQKKQAANLAAVKAGRDPHRLSAAIAAVRDAARTGKNLMPPIIESAKAYASEQEICDVLREELGTYSDPAEF
jgi:methylmalonyl-CoA mutase N-terminal domain/subunit